MLIPIIYESESIVAGLSLSKSKLTPRDRYYLKLVHKKYLDDAPTIALAIKKTVFKQIGHFDETFEYSSDTDLSWRAVKAGIKIRFEPNAILYTDWGDKKREIKRTILYGRGGARLLVKHWRWGWKKYLSTNITTIIYPVLILFSPLAIIYPWYLLIFIALIIKNIREKDPILIVWTNILYGVGVLQGITLILFENTYG
jgi:GT2 family glycosyltransferase